MASRNRLRQDVTKILTQQFKDWGLPKDIEYKSYCDIVDAPVTPRAIQKSYYNWKTAVHSVSLTAPETFKASTPPPPPPPPAPEPDPLEALSQAASADSEESKNDE